MRRATWLVLAALLVAGCSAGEVQNAASPSTTTSTLPDLGPRPAALLAIAAGGGTRLVDLEGVTVAELPELQPEWSDNPSTLRLTDAFGRYLLDEDRRGLAPAPPPSQDLPDDDPPPGATAPSGDVVGHWKGRWPSPDGKAELGLWSGECESRTSWWRPVGQPWRPVLADGAGWAQASVALGWLPDGRAVVTFEPAECGSTAQGPGTYTFTPGGPLTRVGEPAEALYLR